MEFTPITEADFPVRWRKATPEYSQYNDAINALEVAAGFSTQCVWKHHNSACTGGQLAHQLAKRLSKRINFRCKDGTLYVIRTE